MVAAAAATEEAAAGGHAQAGLQRCSASAHLLVSVLSEPPGAGSTAGGGTRWGQLAAARLGSKGGLGAFADRCTVR